MSKLCTKYRYIGVNPVYSQEPEPISAHKFKLAPIKFLLLLPWLAMAGCTEFESKQPSKLLASQTVKVLDWQPLEQSSDRLVFDQVAVPHAKRLQLVASAGGGVELLEADRRLATLTGSFETITTRLLSANASLFASVDNVTQAIQVGQITGGAIDHSITFAKQHFEVSGVCLYQNPQQDNFLFVVSEQGIGQQWLLGNGEQLLQQPLLVRNIPMPPMAQHCQVNDNTGELYINEEEVGYWAYPAQAEAGNLRQAIALVEPFGIIARQAGSLALTPSGLALLDPSAGQILLLKQAKDTWQLLDTIQLPKIADPEQLRVTPSAGRIEITLRDDDTGIWWQSQMDWPESIGTAIVTTTTTTTTTATEKLIPVATPSAQTQPVASIGDAADDPAIWVNSETPSRSLILGTDKKAGLQLYDLAGELIQSLNIGRLNNVDIRSGQYSNGDKWHIAAASHRDLNSISLFTIDPTHAHAQHVADIPTPLAEVYGICLFKPQADELYAFINDKNGEFIQYQIDTKQFTGQPVRQFAVGSQPEGCVADDSTGNLYLAEEDIGVWQMDALPDAPITQTSVITVGQELYDDVEGIALYHRGNGLAPWLVISSQGNDSYLVVDAVPPYQSHGAFRVGLNINLGIDGASETDGLEVVSTNLGGDFAKGLLVVQDGRNRLPQQPQNFKLIPWANIEQVLGLPQN